jgi:acyl-CoA thioesterase
MTTSPAPEPSAGPFIDLQSTHNPHRWILPVTPPICVGPPDRRFLFGGVGMASSVMAMERTCGRPVVWAAAQYLSFARAPAIVNLDVVVPVEGKYNSQARVVGHVGDTEVFTVNAALGERPNDLSAQWVKMTDVPPPDACEPRPRKARHRGENLHQRMDVRIVKGRYGIGVSDGELSDDGHVQLWARFKQGGPIDSAALCVIADFIPSAVGNAIGRDAGGNSLDNTIRFRRIVPTEWVLCDIRIHGIHGGFVHGRMHLFAQDGELMASASQSMILRIHDGK